jgi:hypothetical protein
MFINESQLKRLIKNSYKNNILFFGDIEDGLVIGNNSFVLCIENNYIPNSVKAMIMEIAGILPAKGELYSCSKKEPMLQTEDPDVRSFLKVKRNCMETSNVAVVTNITVTQNNNEYKAIQVNNTGEIHFIRKECVDLIDAGAIDIEYESAPGKATCGINGVLYYWRNATTTLMLCEYTLDTFVKEGLEQITFDKDLRNMEE